MHGDVPKWFMELFWEEVRNKFPIAFLTFLQGEDYDWSFDVKLKEISANHA